MPTRWPRRPTAARHRGGRTQPLGVKWFVRLYRAGEFALWLLMAFVAAAAIHIALHASQYRTAAERWRAAEIRGEDESFYARYGFKPGDNAFVRCARDLDVIRMNEAHRLTEDTLF